MIYHLEKINILVNPEKFWGFFQSLPSGFRRLFDNAFCGSYILLESVVSLSEINLPKGHEIVSKNFQNGGVEIRTKYDGMDVRYVFKNVTKDFQIKLQ